MDIPIRILLTGFEPFGKNLVNPSELVVRSLSSMHFEGAIVDTLILPVSFSRSSEIVIRRMNECPEYDYIISLGVANKREYLSIERVAINCMDATNPDNDGFFPHDQFVVSEAPAAYFTTLPTKEIAEKLQQTTEALVKVSNTAGTYVCNALLYKTLHEVALHNFHTRCGFIHFPSMQFMSVAQMTESVCTIVRILVGSRILNFGVPK